MIDGSARVLGEFTAEIVRRGRVAGSGSHCSVEPLLSNAGSAPTASATQGTGALVVRAIEQRFAGDRKEVQSLRIAFFSPSIRLWILGRPIQLVHSCAPLDGSKALKQVLDL